MPSDGGEHGCPPKACSLTDLIMIFLSIGSGLVIAKNNNLIFLKFPFDL